MEGDLDGMSEGLCDSLGTPVGGEFEGELDALSEGLPE